MKSFFDMMKLMELAELGTDKPAPLSKITPELAKVAVNSGQKDNNPGDDKTTSANLDESVPVGSLKPMQKEVIASKALGMAISFLLSGKPNLNDMEAIVSSDNYIMDGHHRWAAATLIDPSRTVSVSKIDLPASKLVTALNLWTKAKGRSGNTGKGDVTQFASTIPNLIDEMMAKGTPDSVDKNTGDVIKGFSPEQVKEALGKIPNANGDANQGAAIMKQNATKLPTQKHPDAPERVDMPVVKNKEEIKEVVNKLIAGDIDWNVPLSKDTTVASGATNTSLGAGVSTDSKGQTVATPGMPGTFQQNVTPQQGQVTQQNVGAQQGKTTQQNVVMQNKQAVKNPVPQQQQQRLAASTSHEGPTLNEWLVLSGVVKN